MLIARLVLPVLDLAGAARRWPVDSQRGAQRNAMVACTATTRRRVERQEVEDYLERLEARRDSFEQDQAHHH
ncbi:hypothetical protein I601_2435 [Nocardioides dokdonensis FR1436]|uniref:Uncharacterized protein n=1 Tax=Nocardioides dokdonensis FR1436 TaxID=1300347 RepID=A0A1A9GMM3_9ACTN|nr:hypothetical protein [Nocardioides dokdonensis]ANH38853.1 hypothetical protein I601_2435 [Nocardioides dokdonensis FR1436]